MKANVSKFMPCWKRLKPPYNVGKDDFQYKDTLRDYDGWIDVEFCKPLPYDLVKMKTPSKICNGWWNGREWEGIRLREDEKVLYWKIIGYEYET
jgi:hypothetical protein